MGERKPTFRVVYFQSSGFARESISKETEDSSSRFVGESERPTRQSQYKNVGKPRRYEDGDFDTQFRPKERTRVQRKTEEVKLVVKTTSMQAASTVYNDAARQYQERQTDRRDVRSIGRNSATFQKFAEKPQSCHSRIAVLGQPRFCLL